jgi:hypothetical protein
LHNNGIIDKDEARRKVNFGPSKAKRAHDFRIPSNIVYEDDAALIPVPMQPQAPPEPEEDEVEQDGRLAEIAGAYLGNVAARLQKTAIAKAAKGSKEFILWCDSLTAEDGPPSMQATIKELYAAVSQSCYDCTSTAKTDDELKQQVEASTATFTSIAAAIIERMMLCTN